jgi:hypothetical protein
VTQEEREAAVAKLEDRLAGLFARLKVFTEAEQRNGYATKESVALQAYYREQIYATDVEIDALACPVIYTPGTDGDLPTDI